jgi:hypothetical protein
MPPLDFEDLADSVESEISSLDYEGGQTVLLALLHAAADRGDQEFVEELARQVRLATPMPATV